MTRSSRALRNGNRRIAQGMSLGERFDKFEASPAGSVVMGLVLIGGVALAWAAWVVTP